MKRWRRSASAFPGGGASPPPPPAAPLVVTAVLQGDESTVLVTFDQPVTWNAIDNGTFNAAGNSGSWSSQAAANAMAWNSNGDAPLVGDPWIWTAPDTSLTPVPDDAQAGTVT